MVWNKFETAGEIIGILEGELALAGFELLDVRVFRGGGRINVRIFIDGEDGVTLDQCAEAARTAGMLLEEADPIADAYVIELSSPGIRRPLRTLEHFRAQVGRPVEMRIKGGERPKRLRGALTGVTESGVTLQPADEGEAAVEIALADILEANLEAEFDAQALINADRRQRKEAKRQDRQQRRKSRKSGRERPSRSSSGGGSGKPDPGVEE